MNNKLGITDLAALARAEEKISKKKALALFEKGLLATSKVGSFKALANIHKYLFEDIYDFAGKVRDVNIAKGGFPFASVTYLEATLDHIVLMPQSTFAEIIEKYVEMNVAHPFRDGNGRSMRIWLDTMLKKEISQVVDWRNIGKEEYHLAMEKSPANDMAIKTLLMNALTEQVSDREVYVHGIDTSFEYEGFNLYKTEKLSEDQ